MPPIKLPAGMAQASQHYRAQLNGQVRVGEVARYLAQSGYKVSQLQLMLR